MKLNVLKLTAMLLIPSSLFSCSDESIYNLDETKKENSTKISLVPCFTHNTSLDDFDTKLWEVNYGNIKYCGSIRPKN